MIIVFDLDDTLYDEITFVKSGFFEVANYLEREFSLPQKQTFNFMIQRLNEGRGKIFDDTLLNFGLFSKKGVERCLSVYRKHQPYIQLDVEADNCLKRFSKYPIYIVTDGNKLVQKNKLVALGLNDRVKFSYITHRYGIRNAKPSPFCFQHICHRENVEPNQVVYIGDNPNKDFVGIKPLGFKTVRLLKGNFKDFRKTPMFEADLEITSLRELTLEQINLIITDNKK